MRDVNERLVVAEIAGQAQERPARGGETFEAWAHIGRAARSGEREQLRHLRRSTHAAAANIGAGEGAKHSLAGPELLLIQPRERFARVLL